MKKISVVFIILFFCSWPAKAMAQSNPLPDNQSIFWIAPQVQRFGTPCESTTGNIDCLRDLIDRLGGNSQNNIKAGATVVSWYLSSTSWNNAGFTNYGKDNDWHFKPNSYDPDNTTGHRNDNLEIAYIYAQRYNWNVFVDLAGEPWGEWIDCDDPIYNQKDPQHIHDRCSSVNSNVATFLEKDNNNVQWDQYGHPGVENYNSFPPMQRNLSLSPYKTTVNNYIKRNLQEAVSYVWNNPDRRARTLGFAVDADGFLTAWDGANKYYDYNPDSIRQFRNWLLCQDIYADGTTYARFRRPVCFNNISEINNAFNKHFSQIEDIDPPRPGVAGMALDKREENLWWREWTIFRQYQVLLYQWQKLKWVEEMGVPANMIYGYHGLNKFDPTKAVDFVTNRDIYAATMEGAGPAPYGMGVSLYSIEAVNADNQFLQRMKNQNANWVSPETNPSGVDFGATPVSYDNAFRSLHEAFLQGSKLLAPVAWHVPYYEGGQLSNGISKIRDTAYEDAVRDFVTVYGKYPRGSLAWEFGTKSQQCVDKTGVTNCRPTDQIDHTNLESWTPNNQLNNDAFTNGVVSFTVNGLDPYFTSPGNLSYQAKPTDLLKIRMKFDTADNVLGQIYWANPNWGATKSMDFTIIADGQWHDYDLPVGQSPNWNGTINQFRIDPGGNNTSLIGKRVSFDSVWLYDSSSIPASIPGDLNDDNKVDILDLRQLVGSFTNIFDYNLVVGNFGK